jgi:hypothetical protein
MRRRDSYGSQVAVRLAALRADRTLSAENSRYVVRVCVERFRYISEISGIY